MKIIYFIISILIKKRIRSKFKGNLIIIFPHGQKINLGNVDNAPVVKILKFKAFLRIIFLGIYTNGYSYLNKEWDTNNLSEILTLGLKNMKLLKSINLFSGVNSFFLKYFTFYLSNTIKASKKQIKFHYDLGNKFYSKWLDKSMTYSSGIYYNKNNTLECAQKDKFKSLVKLAKINKKSKILEIGCGWGGFMSYVKNNVGSDITGITISEEQYRYVKKKREISDRIKLLDYRMIKNTYDKIISIEMFEAVGKKNWNKYFKILNKALKRKGAAVLQIITIDEKISNSYQYRKDFIQKYIFPGGMLPTKGILESLAYKNKLSFREHRSFGLDYARTLSIWRRNFLKNWNDIEKLGFDENFKRLWEYYLCYCEAGFKAGTINVSQFVLEKK